MNSQPTCVFVVDDDLGIQKAVRRSLECAGIQVVPFSSGEACIDALGQQPCNAVLADVIMDGMGGLALLRTIRRRFPWLPVVMMTGYGDVALAVSAMRAGAADFIEKPLDREQLLAAVHHALQNAATPDQPLQAGLSDAEAQVLGGIVAGKTSKQIADSLNRSLRTIESHRHHIMRKFGVTNVAQLMQKAISLGLQERRST